MSCKYCTDLGRYKGIIAEVFEQTAVDDVFEVEIPVNFCPSCGKCLTEPKPLTLDELKERDGKPVWIEPMGWRKFRPKWSVGNANYGVKFYFDDYTWLPLCEYDKTWIAFDRELEVVE